MRIALAILLFPFSARAASITGLLINLAGEHIFHATVALDSGTKKYQAQTDNAGVYQFSNLPAGEYKLKFQAMGFKRLTLTSVALSEGEQKRIPEVTLDVAELADCGYYPPAFRLLMGESDFGSLAGRVDGIADVEVTLVCRTFSACRSTKTDLKGFFSFRMLSPGEYGLSFRSDGFYPVPPLGNPGRLPRAEPSPCVCGQRRAHRRDHLLSTGRWTDLGRPRACGDGLRSLCNRPGRRVRDGGTGRPPTTRMGGGFPERTR